MHALNSILLITFLACSACSKAAVPAAKFSDHSGARSAYLSAEDGGARLGVAIEVLNQGLIRRWGSVTDVDEIFGTTLARQLTNAVPTQRGVVAFHSNEASPSDDVAAGFSGWYLVVEFDSNGVIHNYFISNAGK